MENYTILFVDDDKRYAEPLLDRAYNDFGINLRHFENWEEASSELDDKFEEYHAVVIDGKGKKTKESKGDDIAHVVMAIRDLSELKGKGKYIPYVVLSKYLDIKDLVDPFIFFEKGKEENAMFKYLIEKIKDSGKEKIRLKYPEPFQCFSGEYLDRQYESFLINIVSVFENEKLTNPENLLFNPCMILLERVFEKITEKDNTILPYALLNFEDQRVGLANCSKYLNGQSVKIKFWENGRQQVKDYQCRKFLSEHISQQIQTIISICHPASHDIQNYSQYTFKSVLWAIFDVLIWLKIFVDERH